MKILAVSYYLPPIRAPQSMQIGRLLYHLPKKYELYVACAAERGGEKDGFYGDISEKFADCLEIPSSQDNRYLNIIKSRLPVLYKRPDPFLAWHEKAFGEIVKRWGGVKFDATITFAYPFSAHVLGCKLKKRFGAKWIAHFSDPWAGNPYNRYDLVSEAMNRRMERKAVEEADTSIFVSQEFRDSYAKRYPGQAGKFRVLEHSYDPSLYRSAYKPNSKLTLRYVGNFYGPRSPEPLLKALRELARKGVISEENFSFEMVGSGMRVPSLISKYGAGAIAAQRPPVSYAESLSLMRQSEALAVIDGNLKGESVFLPSKLIDYIGSGRPVVGITPKGSASERVIRWAGGLVAEPSDEAGITGMLGELVERHAKGRLSSMEPPGKILETYSIKNKIREFGGMIDSAVG